MRRGHLPLTALRSFETAGRNLSFSKAAEELLVSQAAISRQVRELEIFVGKPLFVRLHRKVALTSEGKRLLDQLTASFDDINGRLSEICVQPNQIEVKISAEPSFAGSWLVPRLNHFRTMRPDIDISVDVDPRLVDLQRDGIDLAVRHSATTTSWPRTQSQHLVAITLTPLLAPSLLSAGPPLEKPADLGAYTLLHEESRGGWNGWFLAAGVLSDPPSRRGPIFPDATLATQAAILGHGVVLGNTLLNGEDLRSGRLIQPFALELPYGAYFLVVSSFEKLSEEATAFADWLRDGLVDESA